MRKTRLLVAAIVIGAIAGVPGLAAAIETGSPAPPQNPPAGSTTPPKQTTTKKPKQQKNSSAEDFLNGWHQAYALIYDKADYVGGIAVLHTLGYDDNADVATLIGYASRKLGRYDDAKYWYDKALAADPDHALTWSLLRHVAGRAEPGNVLKAKDDLERSAPSAATPPAANTSSSSRT